MSNHASPPPRNRATIGRPRTFDVGEALSRAVPVFREHGYDGASIDLLKAATGLTAGSLYKAFRDKKALFAAAFAHYVESRRQQLAERLSEMSTGRDRLGEVVRFYLESASGSEGRQGCLVLAGMIEATTLDGSLHDALAETLAGTRAALVDILREGQRDGSIRADLSVEVCADLLVMLLQGLRAVGKLRDPADHEGLIATALKIID